MGNIMAENQQEFNHIVRIANADIDGNRQVLLGLQKIKGVSFMLANAFCVVASVDKTKKIGYLSADEVSKLDSLMKNKKQDQLPAWLLNRRKDYETGDDLHYFGADLSFLKETDLRREKKIKSYKGIRHMHGLPVRGQRTRSNFRPNKKKVQSIKRGAQKQQAQQQKAKGKKK